MNGTTKHEWATVHDASHRSDVEDKLSRKPFCPTSPTWRPLKISPQKVEKPKYGTELYQHAGIFLGFGKWGGVR